LQVVETQSIISHVNLEGRKSVLYQRGQFLPKHFRGGVCDNEVKTVVDDCFGPRALGVFLNDLAQRLPVTLSRKGQHGRRPAKNCRHRARVKIVCGHDPVRALLFNVAMTFHTAGQDVQALCIDLDTGSIKSGT
jgi:hypothetical protein